MYKKFCLALTNVGVPQLIAFDLVAVSPMSSMYGNVAYEWKRMPDVVTHQ